MMKILASMLAAVLIPLTFASPADATRPIVGFKFKDECNNIKGKQPFYMIVGTGPYRLDLSTHNPHDCVRRVRGVW